MLSLWQFRVYNDDTSMGGCPGADGVAVSAGKVGWVRGGGRWGAPGFESAPWK